MADRAEDIEPLLTAFQKLPTDFDRRLDQQLSGGPARIPGFILVELASGYRSGNQRSGRSSIHEKHAWFQRIVTWLITHVAMASETACPTAQANPQDDRCGIPAKPLVLETLHRGTL
jgi:hypothetical protein